MKTLSLALLSILTIAGAVACVPSDDHDHVTIVAESEPNDTAADATQMPGSGTIAFIGVCATTDGDIADCFDADASAGTIETKLYVTDKAPNSDVGNNFAAEPAVKLSITDDAAQVISEAPSVTPSTPADLKGNHGAPGKVHVKVTCDPAKNLWYTGTIHIP